MKWYHYLGMAFFLVIIGMLIGYFLHKDPIVPDNNAAIQRARMEQLAIDLKQFSMKMDSAAKEYKKIDSLYKLKERSNELLWEKLQKALGIINTMPPDSINNIFARDTESPPCW